MRDASWPPAATSQATLLAWDWIVFAVAGAAVALVVFSLIAFAVVRWRRRPGDALPPQFRSNNVVEIAWTALPAIIVCVLFVYTYRVEASVDALDPHPAVVVHATAYRWGWRFDYEGGPHVGGAAGAPLPRGTEAPPQLVLPLGQTTRIDVRSIDVNHAFWVPAFLFKRDAIAGQANAFDLRPTALGTFAGHCAEFCGLNHALMNFSVRVVSPDAFGHWRSEAGR